MYQWLSIQDMFPANLKLWLIPAFDFLYWLLAVSVRLLWKQEEDPRIAVCLWHVCASVCHIYMAQRCWRVRTNITRGKVCELGECSNHCSVSIKCEGSQLAEVLNASFPEGCSMTPYSGLGDDINICKILQNKADFSQFLFPSWRARNLDSSLRVIATICKSQ